MSQPPRDDDSLPPAGPPLRRERAPTITIDTSAVSAGGELSQPQDPLDGTQPTPRIPPEDSDAGSRRSGEPPSPTELRSVQSFEGRDKGSRPTSPHNVSSPTTKWPESQSQNFLAVPGTRSRVNSVDSEEAGNSPGSVESDTYVASAPSGQDRRSRDVDRDVHDIISDPDALKPDPGTEDDFVVKDNKFAFTPGHLNKMLNPKSLSAFYALGGLAGLEKGLRSNCQTGLSLDETTWEGTVSFEEATKQRSRVTVLDMKMPPRVMSMKADTHHHHAKERQFIDRKRVFSDNRLPAKKAKSIWELAWIAYNDKVLILLSVAAAISLALGIYQSITAAEGEPRIQWVEGVAIIVAIVVVVAVGAANDWQKERQFVKLNKKKEDRSVKVIRSGKSVEISVYDILAGDVMHLEPGDMVPVDGVFIQGHNVKCDESSATGESDLLRKVSGADAYRAIENHESLAKIDPFILSGAKVSEGVGTFLVTSTGVNSSYGKTMMSLQDEGETTPLQTKLNILATYIAKLGLAAGLLLFVVLFIKFLASLQSIAGPTARGQNFLQIFIVAVTIIVVAVPEGLPLAVTLALSFATSRMLKDNNLVRLLRACETMGNATTICSDKTGTLTQNKMTVIAGTIGTASRFGDKASQGISGQNGSNQNSPAAEVNDVTPTECIATLSSSVKDLLKQSIVLNSTAFEGDEDGVTTFIGSKTETALLSFARDYLALGSLSEERSNATIVQLIPFDSGRKCMGVVMKLPNGKFRMFVKGASEILIAKCAKIVLDPAGDLAETPLTNINRTTLEDIVESYASRSLRTIGMVYRDYDQWPPRGSPTQEDDRSMAVFEPIFKDMVFLGVVGIQDPLRPGVTESVIQCQKAGVFVRMVTGDNLTTAKAIAQECGIFTAGGVAMEGPRFRKLSSQQMSQLIPRLQVLARSSPEDKKILVSQLKKLGETVAVTGDGTNDAPALKAADVGFSMGIAGTEVAKEASAIILMDDNFTSIVKAISWGRTVNDAVKKFLQFQITVNITAVIVTFVSAVADEDEESVLTAVQLLWVNLIMDSFAALALATDPPTETILDRKPEPKSAPLITLTMWKMIIGQSIYQLVVIFILNFAGENILNYDFNGGNRENERARFKALIFNTFVFMQIFNQYNSRRIDNGFNIFEGLLRNRWFIGIQFIIVAGQVLIIFVGGEAFHTKPLNGVEWGVSIILGLLSMPMAVIIRLIPDEFIQKLIPEVWTRKKTGPQVFVSDEDRFEWNPALQEIKDQLAFLKTVRGGRLNHLKHKLKHPEILIPRSRSGSRSRDSSIPQTPVDGAQDVTSPPPGTPESRSRNSRSRSNSNLRPAAVMAGVVAGSIGGWSPVGRGVGEADSLKFSRSSRHSGLGDQKGIEVHPDTRDDDPVVSDYPYSTHVPPSQNPDLAPDFPHGPSHSGPPSHGRRSTSRQSRQSSNNNTNNRPPSPAAPPS
ncbi:Ca2+-transporting ATPase, variant [Blastomyces dermatitidis ER-3]|uniref:Calcium-transporting ATPase n=3 Tax=Blastomyces TaxID=229219 RepID=A0A179U6S7_BLAGS|nr:Ca2+-transporting ATPase [Blastomyces gilchristii SLH14081]XP_045272990.1 Ca2+-transporting ATPase [Blastomyces dermatitidis ER-3]XP_045282555.1 Ca2+-transporting ATPase, variant [Blastomyces dermatitidis ER-3]EGE78230.1 Ca2+-transporting ATPase [Blastomyces dermatitidis ATCC 18188]EQL37673.1 Ca2+-transporting ATPase [Blastomyces dermatitidis ATCC 26199]EEQ85177.1 Ca2+-transporting ATPase [Blastomyces dermatitidis ER-3]OAT02828.1 Ca2+-transporting ATPase, variant [Blastomyces dermatitidis 